ncbi:Mdm1p NDAI_0E00390 [Naumovozyma dairenensis CBS 421]|uniref:PXA domain-containing protein n=1 Tax=Naumovozyma dairenensis (strain ATCC 10597 / BCRC 20456 / CBS 421 / NBRC 0211 / NRRL Y-12639) TaxID=1071378 RepID=G0WAT5_NAUDC|nr:hypothetical protein NDAI_0E00390 [Naumovozyma dairenensis CBS 421]CCD24855.1 hypothetical protein NDAI_0E00390 [Naumovozyma dairenensis CBS 421]
MSTNGIITIHRYRHVLGIIVFLLIARHLFWILTFGVLPLIGFFLFTTLATTLPDINRPVEKHLKRAHTPETNSFSSINEPIFEKSSKISKELENIIDLILRDFINSWFTRIDPNEDSSFPKAIRCLLRLAVINLQKRVATEDTLENLILKLLPLFTKYVNTYCDARESILNDPTSQKALQNNFEFQLAVEFNKNYKLHKAIPLRSNELDNDIGKYLNGLSQQLLSEIIDENELKSPFVSILLREIMDSCIFNPLVSKFTDPDTWNLIMISIGEKKMKERTQVKQIRRILTKELQGHSTSNSPTNARVNLTNIKLDLKPSFTGEQFEMFLKELSSMNSITELRANKFILMTKLVELRKNIDNSQIDCKYKDRLLLSLKLVQSKLLHNDMINNREANKNDNIAKQLYTFLSDEENILDEFESFIRAISFDFVSSDKLCLNEFKKYLYTCPDKKGITLLKYWEIVESSKNPLEDVSSNEILLETTFVSSTEIRSIYSELFQDVDLQIMKTLDKGLVSNVLLFLSTSNNGDEQALVLARRSLLLLQKEAERVLQSEFFEKFKESKVFLQMISSNDFTKTDIYTKFFTSEKALDPMTPNTHTTNDTFDSVRILTNPDLNEALEKIVNAPSLEETDRIHGNEGHNGKAVKNTLKNEKSIFEAEIQTNRTESFNELELLNSEFNVENSEIVDNPEHGFNIRKLQKMKRKFSTISDKIAQLTISIEEIEKELELLNYLVLKAELTNNQNQLKLLRKSQKALLRELKNEELLQQQCLIKKDANALYRQTKVFIKSFYLEHRTNINNLGETAYYLIDIEHCYNGHTTTWETGRRYNEFFKLNEYLKKYYRSQVKFLQKNEMFPSKIPMSFKYHINPYLLYEERQHKLEMYLRALLNIPEICQDSVFRAFVIDKAMVDIYGMDQLNQSTNDNSTSNSSTHSIPTMKNLNTSSMSSIASNSSSGSQVALYDQVHSNPPADQNNQINVEDLEDGENYKNDEFHPFQNDPMIRHESKPIVKSICNLFISVFQLNRNNSNSNWLRGKAISTVLQQLLGSTIEKYIKINIEEIRSEEGIYEMLGLLKKSLWGVNGSITKRKTEPIRPIRTPGEKTRTRCDSQVVLQSLFIELCGKVVGLSNSRDAAIRVHGMLQNRYLSCSMILEMLDIFFLDVIIKENTTEAYHD